MEARYTPRQLKRKMYALGFETIEIQRAILKGWQRTLEEIAEQKELADECRSSQNLLRWEYHADKIRDLKNQVMDALYPPMTEAEKERCKKTPLFEGEDTIYTGNLIKLAKI